MNKSELVEKMAAGAQINKREATDALDQFISAVTEALSIEGSLSLAGFGTFKVVERSARAGRNPKTGESIQVDAKRVVTFKPSDLLKKSV